MTKLVIYSNINPLMPPLIFIMFLEIYLSIDLSIYLPFLFMVKVSPRSQQGTPTLCNEGCPCCEQGMSMFSLRGKSLQGDRTQWLCMPQQPNPCRNSKPFSQQATPTDRLRAVLRCKAATANSQLRGKSRKGFCT